MTAATRALEALLEALEDAGIEASRDAGEFDPTPVGVLVGLPTLVSKTLSASAFEIPIVIVTGDPLNSAAAVDRLYAIADDVADAVRTLGYRPTSWAGSSRVEPLPALEVLASVTVTTQEV